MNETKIVSMVLDHEERISNLATKDDIRDLRRDMMQMFDEVLTILRRHDQEIAAINHRLDRVEARLNGVETRLNRVETRLDQVETRLDGLQSDVSQLKSDFAIFRSRR